MLVSVMEWNVWTCQVMECSLVSKNLMFGCVTECNVGTCNQMEVLRIEWRRVSRMGSWRCHVMECC